MGIARREAAGMSRDFVRLAADLASFNNASPVDTLEALRSALSGETEPMRRFGADVRVAALEAFALSKGIKTAWTEMSNAQKTTLLYQKVLHDTKDAQGDFNRTSGSLANQQRIIRAQFDDVAAKLGAKLIPALTVLARWLLRLLNDWDKNRGAMGLLKEMIRETVGTIGDLISAIRATIRWVERAGDAVRRWLITAFRDTQRVCGNVMSSI
jgi:hypothetical protein